MIFNWIYGTELEMEAVTKTYSDITEYSIFHLPLTVSPLAVILRTSAGMMRSFVPITGPTKTGISPCGSAGVLSGFQPYVCGTGRNLMLTCSGGTAALPAH